MSFMKKLIHEIEKKLKRRCHWSKTLDLSDLLKYSFKTARPYKLNTKIFAKWMEKQNRVEICLYFMLYEAYV